MKEIKERMIDMFNNLNSCSKEDLEILYKYYSILNDDEKMLSIRNRIENFKVLNKDPKVLKKELIEKQNIYLNKNLNDEETEKILKRIDILDNYLIKLGEY